MRKVLLIVLSLILALPLGAQTLKDSNYRTVGHIRQDGTVQDSNYKTIGHAKGVPVAWGAVLFFFL